MRALAISLALLAALLTAGAAGCGGDGADDMEDNGGEGTPPAAEVPGGGDPEDVRVIDAWSSALREGHVEEAASYFKLPSIVQNGTPPLQLDDRADVIDFNKALPCGAELVSATSQGKRTTAVFELTERPGPGECGPGIGSRASTAFVIEGGKIAAWIRVGDPPEPEGDFI